STPSASYRSSLTSALGRLLPTTYQLGRRRRPGRRRAPGERRQVGNGAWRKAGQEPSRAAQPRGRAAAQPSSLRSTGDLARRARRRGPRGWRTAIGGLRRRGSRRSVRSRTTEHIVEALGRGELLAPRLPAPPARLPRRARRSLAAARRTGGAAA